MLWRMAKPAPAKNGQERRQLDLVLDLNVNEDAADPQEAPDDWIRRHMVLPNKKSTTTEDQQKPNEPG